MFFRRLRDLREDNDLKQKDIAKLINCSQKAYSNYELGVHEIPIDLLIALAELYKTNTDYLLGLTDNKTYYKKL